MKFLIIDNYSKHISEIVRVFSKVNVDVVGVLDLEKIDFSKYDGFVLSGGSKHSVVGNKKLYSKEIELIKNSDKPILGICLGFELICEAYEEMMEHSEKRIKGEVKVNLVSYDKLFNKIDFPIKVYEAHKWSLVKTKFLKVLAKSDSGIEIIKHPRKLIYGLQFHPEIKGFEQKGLIENFVGIVKKSR